MHLHPREYRQGRFPSEACLTRSRRINLDMLHAELSSNLQKLEEMARKVCSAEPEVQQQYGQQLQASRWAWGE